MLYHFWDINQINRFILDGMTIDSSMKIKAILAAPGMKSQGRHHKGFFVYGVFLAVCLQQLLATGSAATSIDEFRPLYCAQGIFQYNTETKAFTNQQIWLFEVLEDEAGRWRLKVDTVFSHPKVRLESSEIIAYDSKDIYSIVMSPQRIVPAGKTWSIAQNSSLNAGRVLAGPYPIDHSSAVGILWLAFFGGRYVDHDRSRTRFPNLTVPDARTDPTAWCCDFEYNLDGSPSRPLIRKGDYFINKRYLGQSHKDHAELDEPDNDRSLQLQQRQFERAHVATPSELRRASFELLETRTVNSVRVPAVFRCEIARPIGLSPTIEVRLAAKVEVTNVFVAPPSPLLPPVTGHVTVQDRRFRQKDLNGWLRDVLYDLGPDGWIIDTKDPRIRSIVADRPLRPYTPIRGRSALVYRMVVTLVFLFVAVFPCALFFWRRLFGRPKRLSSEVTH
jgi:hypothetical protein